MYTNTYNPWPQQIYTNCGFTQFHSISSKQESNWIEQGAIGFVHIYICKTREYTGYQVWSHGATQSSQKKHFPRQGKLHFLTTAAHYHWGIMPLPVFVYLTMHYANVGPTDQWGQHFGPMNTAITGLESKWTERQTGCKRASRGNLR